MNKEEKKTVSIWFFIWFLCVGIIWADSPAGMKVVKQANFELAQKFSEEQLRSMLKDTAVTPNWIPGGGFWYQFRTMKETKYIIIDAGKQTRAPLFNRKKLAVQLKKLTGKPIDANHLPITLINFQETRGVIGFLFEKQTYQYAISSDTLIKTDSPKEPQRLSYGTYSPDGKWVVYARNYNLYMRETTREAKEMQLTSDGGCYYGYNDYDYDFVDEEKQGSDQPQPASVEWSPDAKKFVSLRTDARHLEPIYVMNSLTQPRPSLIKYKVSLPDEEVRKHEVWIYNHSLQKMIPVKAGKWHGQEYRSFSWSSDSSRFYMVRNSKDQLKGDLLAVDPGTGDVNVLIEERNAGMILTQPAAPVPSSNELVWYSRRDGYGHYYLFDLQGKLKHQITRGRFNASRILHLDEKNRIMYFLAHGDSEEGNPYHTHFYKVHLEGSGLKRLTPEDAHHDILVSPGNTCFIDNFSRVDMAPRSVLRDMKGNLIMALENADISLLIKSGWEMPTVFKEKAADGKMDIWGVMWKPFDFDPGKKYPVITFVYPGPQDEIIPRRFFERNENVHLAQYGFIVLMYGNRGGSQVRSLEYSEFYRGNLRDYGIEDKKVVIEQLAREYSFIDLDRVGIWGGSSGGYMTVTAMLLYPDFFKVGVSRSGVQDPSVMYRWWGDSFHGMTEIRDKNGKARLISKKVPSNLEIAEHLRGRLLLIQGEADTIVHPANAIRLADVLMSLNKRFDYILVPGGGHGASKHWGYIKKRIWLYFIEHLLGDRRYQNCIDLSSFMIHETHEKTRKKN